MPKAVEKLVKKIKKTVKPRKGQTKEQAAWAIAMAIHKKKTKK